MITSDDPSPLSDLPPRRRWVWIVSVIAIVLAIAVTVTVVAWRMYRADPAREQLGRFQMLASALRNGMGEDQALPEQPPATLSATDASGRTYDRATLLTDVATGQPAVYRVVTTSGERIGYSLAGDRPIAWSPQANYGGRRAVLLNSFELTLAREDELDLAEQRLLREDPLNKTRPKLSTSDGDEGAGAGEGGEGGSEE